MKTDKELKVLFGIQIAIIVIKAAATIALCYLLIKGIDYVKTNGLKSIGSSIWEGTNNITVTNK